MKGFKNISSALIFCTAFEEIQQLFRMKNKTRRERRRLLAPKFQEMKKLFMEAACFMRVGRDVGKFTHRNIEAL